MNIENILELLPIISTTLSLMGIVTLIVVITQLKKHNRYLHSSLVKANQSIDELMKGIFHLSEVTTERDLQIHNLDDEITRRQKEKEAFIAHYNSMADVTQKLVESNNQGQQYIWDLEGQIELLRAEIQHIKTNRLPRGLQRKQAKVTPINFMLEGHQATFTAAEDTFTNAAVSNSPE